MSELNFSHQKCHQTKPSNPVNEFKSNAVVEADARFSLEKNLSWKLQRKHSKALSAAAATIIIQLKIWTEPSRKLFQTVAWLNIKRYQSSIIIRPILENIFLFKTCWASASEHQLVGLLTWIFYALTINLFLRMFQSTIHNLKYIIGC